MFIFPNEQSAHAPSISKGIQSNIVGKRVRVFHPHAKLMLRVESNQWIFVHVSPQYLAIWNRHRYRSVAFATTELMLPTLFQHIGTMNEYRRKLRKWTKRCFFCRHYPNNWNQHAQMIHSVDVFLSVRFLGKSNTVSQRYKSNVPQKIIIVMGEISIRAFCDRIRHVNRHFLIGRIQSIWCDYGSTNTHKHEEKSGFNTFQWGCRWCNLYHKI